MIGLALLIAAATQSAAPPVIRTPPPVIVMPKRPTTGDPLAGITAEGRAAIRAQMPIESARREAAQSRVAAAHLRLMGVMAKRPMDIGALRAALDARDTEVDSNRRAQTAAAIELMSKLTESDRQIVARALLSDGDRSPLAR